MRKPTLTRGRYAYHDVIIIMIIYRHHHTGSQEYGRGLARAFEAPGQCGLDSAFEAACRKLAQTCKLQRVVFGSRAKQGQNQPHNQVQG